MSQPEPEPRQLTPVQLFWDGKQGVRDFGPRVSRVDENEAKEEDLTPAPKASSVPESADSKESNPPDAPPKSEIPALPETTIPTEENSDVDKENGKGNESSEAGTMPTAPPAPPTPPPAPSLPSSSSVTKSGNQEQPVSEKLQTSE